MAGKIRRRPTPPEYIVRRVDGVPLTFLNEQGDQVKENFSIEYKALTPYGLLQVNEKLGTSGPYISGEHLRCAFLAEIITAIIDSDGDALTDDEGQRAQLTAAFFAGLLEEDREGMEAAIKANASAHTDSPGASSAAGPVTS